MLNKVCRAGGCSRKVGYHGAKGLCPYHYQVFRKTGKIPFGMPKPKCKNAGRICSVAGCDSQAVTSCLCAKHYARLRRHGDPNLVTRVYIGATKKYAKLYRTYNNMHSRCEDSKNKAYKNYGGRGISVCDRWSGVFGFRNFLKDMGQPPKGKTLDRIDNDKGYFPENCRWANRHQQAANRRRKNKYSKVLGVSYEKNMKKWIAQLTVDGVTHTSYYNTEQEAIFGRKLLEKEYAIEL